MKNIVIIDLDGTLISRNSFHVWLKVLIIVSLKKLDLITFCKIQLIIFLRLLHIYSRTTMKSLLLNISIKPKYICDVKREVVTRCIPFLRKNLIDEIIKFNFDYIIVASAAPLFYLESIAEKSNIPVNKVIGSSFKNNIYFECVAENKKSMVNTIKNNLEGISKIYFFTDHFEDLPTAMIADEVFLVEPSKLTIEKFNQSKIKYIKFSQ